MKFEYIKLLVFETPQEMVKMHVILDMIDVCLPISHWRIQWGRGLVAPPSPMGSNSFVFTCFH